MPFEVSSPFLFTVIEVANSAARLALPQSTAAGKIVRELDTGSSYALVPGGLPNTPGDWKPTGGSSGGGATDYFNTMVGPDGTINASGASTVTFEEGDGITINIDPLTNKLTFGLTPPYLAPTFSAFGITGYSNNSYNEVGTTLTSPLPFTWSTTNNSNITSGMTITSPAGGTVLVSNTANDGTQSVAVGSPVTDPFTTSSKTFRISATQITGPAFTRDFTLLGGYPWYYGKVTTGVRPTPASALVTGGTKVLASSTGTVTAPFASGAGDYIWFATPSTSTTKTKWTDSASALNTGTIGGAVSPGGNLFPDPSTVSVTAVLWAGVNYKVYVSNYQTAINSLILSNT